MTYRRVKFKLALFKTLYGLALPYLLAECQLVADADYSHLTDSHVLYHGPRLIWVTRRSPLPVLGCGMCCQLYCV